MISLKVTQSLDVALSLFDPDTASELRLVTDKAIKIHASQNQRPSGEAYENHVVRVATRIANQFGIIDKELFIAGLLHDSVEDQIDALVGKKDATRQEAFLFLTQRYSPRISNIVRGVSNTEEYETTQNRTERNKLYIDHVIQECNLSDDCLIVKLSDFFDNAMQLQYNSTHEAKIRGASKYLPLFDYFIGVLSSQRALSLAPDIRTNLIEKIKQQKNYVIGLI